MKWLAARNNFLLHNVGIVPTLSRIVNGEALAREIVEESAPLAEPTDASPQQLGQEVRVHACIAFANPRANFAPFCEDWRGEKLKKKKKKQASSLKVWKKRRAHGTN